VAVADVAAVDRVLLRRFVAVEDDGIDDVEDEDEENDGAGVRVFRNDALLLVFTT
jgi:hypothetical protein